MSKLTSLSKKDIIILDLSHPRVQRVLNEQGILPYCLRRAAKEIQRQTDIEAAEKRVEAF
jgi:hypothetical protein